MNILKRNKGFTLLELLVVISIIGILIAVGAAAFTTAQKKGRDARRRADMKAFQTVFEQYYAENGNYATCGVMDNSFSGGSPPVDPDPTASYDCTDDGGSVTKYCVCAELDFDTTGNGSGSSGGDCTFSGATDFCVQNLQ